MVKEKLSICDKACLTLEEAAEYFNIGINKLREMTTIRTMDVYMEATKDAKKKSFTDLEGKITLM